MLAKANRLIDDRDFKRVFKFGQSFYSPNLRLKLAKNRFDLSRFGFVIGLAVHKKATVRNRLKRQVREVVRLLLKNGLIETKFDVVINVKTSLIGRAYPEIKSELEFLFRKAGILA